MCFKVMKATVLWGKIGSLALDIQGLHSWTSDHVALCSSGIVLGMEAIHSYLRWCQWAIGKNYAILFKVLEYPRVHSQFIRGSEGRLAI